MHMVWDHGSPVTVRELFDELRQERSIAYTTVMSTMDNLHRKGWLARAKAGKAYRYTATASREEYSARLMREALAGGGVTKAVLSHFVARMDGPSPRRSARSCAAWRAGDGDEVPVAGPSSGTPQPLGRTRPRSAAEQVTGEPAGLGQSDEVAAGQ